MRAVLIVNPTATSTTPAARDLLANALKSRLELTVEHTTHAGHGGELAHNAAENGVDLVVVHGGDGTISNVVNGLLGRPGTAPTGPSRTLPAVAVVPGGSANVLTRSLGLSRDPVAATNQMIQLLDDYRRHRTWRRIGLIDCGETWAMINAGMGVDAEVVGAVDAQRKKGAKVTPSRYWRVAVPVAVAFSRREPTLTLELPDRDAIPGTHFAWVSNTTPWTYSNERSLVTNPGCSFETGLGVFAVTSMKFFPTLGLVRQMLSKRANPQAKQLVRDDDAAWLRVTTNGEPAATQFDGEYLGLRESMTFRAVPDALAVVAPPAKGRSDQRRQPPHAN